MDKRLDPIPFIDLASQKARLRGGIDAAIARVLDHGQYVLGPEVSELEEALRSFTGAAHCVSCANGTDALTLVMMAEGIGPGDAVIVPSFTFVATAETVAQLGATPVFADIRADTFNLDVESMRRAVTAAQEAGLTPRAVIPVDLFGLPADYAAIEPVAREHGMIVIADAAQSLGAAVHNRRAGILADYTTTSFFPAKPLGCYGDGGAIFLDSAEKAQVLRSLRMHGEGSDRYENVRIGINSRLDTLQAAILLEKLSIFEDEIEARDRVAERYAEALGGLVTVPAVPQGYQSVWAQYTLVLPQDADRAAIQAQCRNEGIPTAIYYPIPLHRQEGYSAFPSDAQGLPVCEQLAGRVLSLPMHPYLDAATQDRVIASLRGAIGNTA